MRARFRPRGPLRVEVIRDYDFVRDLAAIRVTDGTAIIMMPVTNELLFQCGDTYVDYMIETARERLDKMWRRIIAERSPRMRAAYDRKRRARRARARA